MNRLVVAALALGAILLGSAFAYQAQRESAYRDLLAQGDRALREGTPEQAIEALTRALDRRPDSVIAYLRRGEAHLTRGNLGAAAGDFRRASDLDPLAARPLEELGDVRERRGFYDQAAAAYEARLALDDTSAAVTYKLALARYGAGDLDGAMLAVERALSLSDALPEAHYLLGMCLRDLGRSREALAVFERAVTIDPAFLPAREELAHLLGELGRPAEQVQQIQIMSGLSGEQTRSQFAVGLAYARAARTARDPGRRQRYADLAVLTLGGALDDAVDETPIRGALGGVWLRIAEERQDAEALANALEALGRAAASDTATSEVLTTYGRALRMNGDLDTSLLILSEASRRFPIEPESLLELASLADERGQSAIARTARLEYAVLTGSR